MMLCSRQKLYSIVLWISSIVFFSCTQDPYAVVLQSTNTIIHNNDLVRIVSVDGENVIVKNANAQKVQFLSWQIREFEIKERAQAFQNKYEKYKNMYAVSKMQALPIRENSEINAKVIYRLKQNERIKIFMRVGDEVELSQNIRGYWYQVVTESGIIGYCFGYNLQIVDYSQYNISDETHSESFDIVKVLQSTVWRPYYFETMYANKQYNMNEFRADVGLFIDVENQKLRLQLSDNTERFIYPYSELIPLSNTKKHYRVMHAPWKISILDANRINVVYVDIYGIEKSIELVNFTHDVPTIIREEQMRRHDLFLHLTVSGSNMYSDYYGRLQFDEMQNFTWDNIENVQQQGIIASDYSDSGKIAFDVYLLNNKSQYNGVITFYFDNKDTPVYFLYNRRASGIQLSYLSNEYVQDGYLAQLDTISPFNLFFEYEYE